MDVGPFLKESVKLKRLPSGFLRSGSVLAPPPGSTRPSVALHRESLPLSRSRTSSRLSSLRFGKLQSFLASAIAPNTFLRNVPPTITASGSAGSSIPAGADVSGANSSPPGPLHPTRRAARPDHRWSKPPHPRSDSSWPQREGSQAAPRQLRSNNRAPSGSPCLLRAATVFPIVPLRAAAFCRSHPPRRCSSAPLRRRRAPGTRHRSCACSACAR
jgi:hypothetical protein